MPEEETIAKAKIKYKGSFDLGDAYDVLHDLFVTMGFTVEESKYKETVKGDKKDLQITWDCEKNVDDYTKFIISVNFFILGFSKQGADAEINFKCKLRTDYEGRWDANPFLKFMKGVFQKYLYRGTYAEWKTQVRDEMYQIKTELESYLRVEKIVQ